MGSSRIRAQTRVPCIGRRILNHCATREVPRGRFLPSSPAPFGSCPLPSLFSFSLAYSNCCAFLVNMSHLNCQKITLNTNCCGPQHRDQKHRFTNVICSNVDGPRDYHTKWRKSDRERQIPYDITYKWNLKNSTNELIYKTKTDSQTENKLMVTKGEGGKG